MNTLRDNLGVTAPIKATYNPRQRKRGQKSGVPSLEEIMSRHRSKTAAVDNRSSPAKKKLPASHLGAGIADATGFKEDHNDLDQFLKVKKKQLDGLKKTSKLGLGVTQN